MTEHKPWLSLPDEDPPERGFAELMAAARAKAEIMANPPWWKRVFELLKRPPVLALATVVVLIGGVIIVHREPAEVSAPVAAPPPATEPTPIEPAAFGAAQLPPPPAVIDSKGVGGRRQKGAESKAEKGKLARPDNARVETGRAEVQKTEEVPVGDEAVQQQIATGTAIEPPPVDHTAVSKPQLAKKRAQAPVDSLARCRAAAANKDCAGLRACAKQLEIDDPQFYKANDATIRSCL
jgi:hypothetical protein